MSYSETVVHVRDESHNVCRAGIVVDDLGRPDGSDRPMYRIRVLMPSSLQDVGVDDVEGNYKHISDRVFVELVPGSPHIGGRYLDSWHRIDSCGYPRG